MYAGEITGQTHTYRAQRNQQCGLTNCVSNWIDNQLKQSQSFPQALLNVVGAAGELAHDSGVWEQSDTVVHGIFPGNGTILWAYTHDIANGGSSTWIDINQAECGETSPATSGLRPVWRRSA